MNDTVEARPPFEFVSLKSIGSKTPLSHHVYKTFSMDNDDNKAHYRSENHFKDAVDREEAPWFNLHLESKAQLH